MAKYRTLTGVNVRGEYVPAGREVELHDAWPTGGAFRPLDDEAHKHLALYDRLVKRRARTQKPLPSTPSRYSDKWERTPPRYRIAWDMEVGDVKLKAQQVVEWLEWPEATGMVPVNEAAEEVVAYMREVSSGPFSPRLPPRPWDETEKRIHLPKVY